MKLGLLVSVLVLSFLDVIHAVGNEEDVLVETTGITDADTVERVAYHCTFRNLWTEARQPVNFPSSGRWAGPILWTHTLQFQPWLANYAVTRGVEKMAEDGFADVMILEMEQQATQVWEYQEYEEDQFFVSETNFVHIPSIEADFNFPYLSMMASIMPSPDWYTGFYSYWLIDEYSRTWYDHIKIQVKPWDAGTDAGQTYTALESDVDPPLVIQRFIPGNSPPGGELLDPTGETVPNVGELECFLVVGEQDLILPDCDWFANPCCNETDTVSCGATLPNGAIPQISPEYAQVLDGGTTADDSLTTAETLSRLEEIAGEMRQLADEVNTLVQGLREDDGEGTSGSSITRKKRKKHDEDL
ncbi:Spondin-1 [Seminavis robusta]|uniref:Spondin-1 n=1 Tax=Seminavis robusta TaxID=568900 RepID=A0A9N8H5Z2_9STRA|nr:Spondin-1 [Seminavis robusta]|eukprot:Sro99_g050800.1 Spondin-1 (358) ;mRNA; f:33488-34645